MLPSGSRTSSNRRERLIFQTNWPVRLLFGAVAFLVLFAGAAGAGIVAADFVAGAALRWLRGFTRSRAGGHFQFTLLLAVKLFFESVDGGGGLPDGNRNLPQRSVARDGAAVAREGYSSAGDGRCGGDGAALGRRAPERFSVGPEDLHAEEEPDGVFLEFGHHGFEHVEGFSLVGHQIGRAH